MNHSILSPSFFEAPPSSSSAPAAARSQDWTAEGKLKQLLKSIENTEYKKLPPLHAPNPFWAALRLTSARFLQKTYQWSSDEMPKGRKRWIHRFGSVAHVRYVPTTPGRFSGLWSEPVDGLIRLSISPPLVGSGIVSGIALKFLVTGHSSENLVLIPRLRLEPRPTFFTQIFNTHIPRPTREDGFGLYFLATRFQEALEAIAPGQSAFRIPLDRTAAIHVNGSSVSNPRAPFAVRLCPTPDAFKRWTEQDDFRVALAGMGEHFPLYEVQAQAKKNAPWETIGHLTVIKAFIASNYGDEVLFFQHPIQIGPFSLRT